MKKIPGFPENKSLASQDPIPGFPGKKTPNQKNEKSIFFFLKCGSAIQMSDKWIKFQKNVKKIRNTLPQYSVQTVEKNHHHDSEPR